MSQRMIIRSNFIFFVIAFGTLLNTTEAYWIRDLSYCPRKREAPRQRQCFKSCFDDSDCRSRYRSCVCDYDCGMSCVKRGVTCPYLTPPEHGSIRYSNGNKFASRATYECDQGYVLEGVKHRDCQGDQQWGPDDALSYCTKEVFCPRPPEIVNAVNDIPSTITSFHAGYSVKYTCLTGYTGNGTSTSECTFLGQWTFVTLKCTPIECGSPGVLRNGFLIGERFDYPNIIEFFCHEGYELVGKDSTRACQENGLWSGTMPICQKKTCPAPPIVRYSELIQPDATTNETVQYICQEGYRLNGSSVLKCLHSEWQPIAPTCEPITCVDPQTIFNGSIRLITPNSNASDTYAMDAIVRFSCPENFTLVGPRRSRCLINGTWSLPIPTCQIPIPCPIPSLPARARYVTHDSTKESMDDGTSLEYVCGNSRYRQRIVCRQGRILPRLPRCFFGCRVKNGSSVFYSKAFYRHRERVLYTCSNSTDVMASTNSTLRCVNGNLTGEPTCPSSRTTCLVPHMLFLRNIANTSIPSGTPIEIGSSFSYQCMPDHQPAMETALVECQTDGKWSDYAQCHPIPCKEHPPTIDHGRTIFRSTMHGAIARYRCFPGYQLDFNHTTRLTCQYGQWIPKQLPRCLPIFCPNPGSLINGRIYVIVQDQRISSQPMRREFRSDIPTVSHGRTIEFQCLPGYSLHGPSGLTCNHGRWLPVERPRCLIEKHVQPKIIFTG